MAPRRRRLLEKLRSLYLWHRYAGLAVAVIAIWLSASGIILNHTDDLELPDSFVSQEWLLKAYSIQPIEDLDGYRLGDHWISEGAGRSYIDRQRLAIEQPLVGVASVPFGFVLAFPQQLQLYTPDAVLVESLPFTASNADISAIATDPDGRVLVKAGARWFRSDAELIEFEQLPARPETASVMQRQGLPRELAEDLARDIRHHSLNWERVLLDMHSGRILGKAGRLLTDIAGLLLLLLSVSGVIIWYKRWKSLRRKQLND